MDDKDRQCSDCGTLESLLADRDLCESCKWKLTKKSYENSLPDYLRSRIKVAKARVRKKGHIFSLSLDEAVQIWEEQKGSCAVTGLYMTHTASNFEFAASLDRIDNNLGYDKSNVRLVCSRVNTMRNDLDTEMLIFWAKAICKNNEN